ncbi:hypothetical protein T10_7866 [Trichinella papuae]|uniref:Uncharacterized protein n=1 Tax=Trichinella papuae TaxID=268474 RepID=A0A0V1MWF4_9BILA|nr:hypothetical protein T10_7866 [Trichinella papuae]
MLIKLTPCGDNYPSRQTYYDKQIWLSYGFAKLPNQEGNAPVETIVPYLIIAMA